MDMHLVLVVSDRLCTHPYQPGLDPINKLRTALDTAVVFVSPDRDDDDNRTSKVAWQRNGYPRPV